MIRIHRFLFVPSLSYVPICSEFLDRRKCITPRRRPVSCHIFPLFERLKVSIGHLVYHLLCRNHSWGDVMVISFSTGAASKGGKERGVSGSSLKSSLLLLLGGLPPGTSFLRSPFWVRCQFPIFPGDSYDSKVYAESLDTIKSTKDLDKSSSLQLVASIDDSVRSSVPIILRGRDCKGVLCKFSSSSEEMSTMILPRYAI